jgi:hypothetical protein
MFEAKETHANRFFVGAQELVVPHPRDRLRVGGRRVAVVQHSTAHL